MTSLPHAVLALAMTSPGAPALHRANRIVSEPAETHYRAHITIDTAALRDELDPKEVEKQQDLFERDVPTLFLADIALAERPSEDVAEVRVLVRWKDFADFRYGVTIEATTPNGKKNETSFDFQGDEHDLVQRLKDEVPTVVGWLQRPEQASTAPPATPAETTPSPQTPPPEPRLHVLGKAGIGVAAVGVAAGVAGAVLFTLTEPTTTLGGGGRESAEERRFPIPSIALMAVGGAALVTGVALLVTDLSHSKKPKPRASLTPALSTHGGGLSLSGRF